jgi:hypothetical protein
MHYLLNEVDMNSAVKLPELPFKEWQETRLTLHLILQIIGKTRLKLTRRKNHWWYITLYVTSRGFGTHSIPSESGLDSFEIEFNVLRRAVILTRSEGEEIEISLAKNPSIADFYKQFREALESWGYKPGFIPKPFDLGIEKGFGEIDEYHHYDWKYIEQFAQVMRWNSDVFQEFSGRFYGKTCPVHIYWHHLDLTVTRFSGKRLPPMDESARVLEKESYSHEQISFGFWAGDDNMPEPMYYAYTFPSPAELDKEIILPIQAKWVDSNGSPMALLRYQDVISSDDPRKRVLEFLESTYQAGADKAGWDIEKLTVPPLDEI